MVVVYGKVGSHGHGSAHDRPENTGGLAQRSQRRSSGLRPGLHVAESSTLTRFNRDELYDHAYAYEDEVRFK